MNTPAGIIKEAGADAWLSGVVAAAVGLLIGGLWVWLASFWPGCGLFELPVAAAGPFFGSLINVLLIVWTLIILTGSSWVGADAILTAFLPETPRVVLCASIIVPAACAARCRLEVLARLSQLAFWLIVTLSLLMVPLSIPQIDLNRLGPVLANGMSPVVGGASVLSGIMSESLALVALLPRIRGAARPGRLMAAVCLVAGAALVALVVWTTLILGPQLPARFQYPVLRLAHVISIGDILERLDALMIALWVVGEVAKVAFWLWLLCTGIAHLFRLPEHRSLVWPASLIVLVGTMAYVENWAQYTPSLMGWTAIFAPLVGIILPISLLVATLLRGQRRHAESV